MNDKTRTVARSYDEDGLPVWHSQTSPTSMTTRAECLMHPDRIIPVIFVPGIMGSNLKSKDVTQSKKIANIWRPDLTGAVTKIIGLNPAGRKKVFNPENVQVDRDIDVGGQRLANATNGFPAKLIQSRGWGTIFWGSYGPLLEYLESNLNDVVRWESAKNEAVVDGSWTPYISHGVAVKSDGKDQILRLTKRELEQVAKYWYPVHAVGYNWLQSNEQSGKDLAREIDAILEHYRDKWGGKAVQKVILVTHSMGGLVARAAVHPKMGNASDKVLGILHGAMPALGAPAAYKRMRAGNEAGGFSINPITVLKSIATWMFLGAYGPDVAPVLGQSPGGLQLLPNQNYPGGWLTVRAGGVSYPIEGNPYKTIYSERSRWWRLVNPDWLDPGGDSGVRYDESGTVVTKTDPAWAKYMVCLSSAEQFHASLGDYYHPVTYAFFGSDSEHKAWGKIQWDIGTLRFAMRGPMSVFDSNAELKKLAMDGLPTSDNGSGTIEARVADSSWMGDLRDRFSIRDAESPGDGTVPHESGLAPGKRGGAIEQFAFDGFDHQSAYLPEMANVMAVTKYAIAKIAQKADWGDV
ncbi:esterase/lipase family protein [Burkholderia gladioli]|uniref:esterase/lipase family protein n=1 Tax=Burkholderia gladioli TaxID=28095 RepID=UPI000F0BB7BB|nr:alpha/beta fold hydrolase [Burkholderia gladioli]AYQ87512.1 hypothetical protein EDD84_09035 [Burkholderia gladioli]